MDIQGTTGTRRRLSLLGQASLSILLLLGSGQFAGMFGRLGLADEAIGDEKHDAPSNSVVFKTQATAFIT